ncbi:hypothetical protein DXH78_13980 [Undibacter mobilis]|uniref:Uncharacterized protein n=1 Tax=Undibacter mobilis TaxID=2292256 RepID=A0A371BDC9_9BRAD|nr:hypothetical protein DXH78_13980 [Undibacter mobilis]
MLGALSVVPAIAATDPVPQPDTLATPQFTAEPVFRDLNLLGNWAVDCDRPASPANPHVNVSAPGAGLIVEHHDVGADFAPNLYHVVAARRVDKRDVEVRALFRPGTESEDAQILVLRIGKAKGADTRRTMFNRGEDGVRVKNGVAVRSGAKTAVLRRCG